ncbi:MAG: class I SAM-dependent methyltransferase [Bacteroidota bacterium]
MNRDLNPIDYNRKAWDGLVRAGNRWTTPFSSEQIQKASQGILDLVLTPCKHVPDNWYPPKGARVLALASGGGQQVPLLAAAGYDVVSYDNSESQLDQDMKTSLANGLSIQCVHGDMNDLSCLEADSFDMVFNPCSTGFVPDVANVYKQVSRVLKPGGRFMTGFVKPVYYLFDVRLVEKGEFKLKYNQPYSDLESLDDDELAIFMNANEPLVYGHSLTAHIKGQLDAGLELADMFEDYWGENNPLDNHFPGFIATLSIRK